MDRPGPELRKRFRRGRRESSDNSALDAIWLPDVFDGPGALAAVAVGVLLVAIFVFVLLPLIGLLLELVVVFALFASGVLSRVLLGRPWTIEARNLDDGERSVAYGVKGFRRAGEAVGELKTALAVGGPPERLARGERTTLPRPGI